MISDEIKDDSELTIKGLKSAGVENIVMLTGDNELIASHVAKQLGIKQYRYSLLPQNKVEEVEALLNNKNKAYGQLLSADKLAKVEELLKDLSKNGKKRGSLIFVGDGINDAPVLARADAGIAMGAMGADADVEASDVIIMEDKPSKIVDAIKISRKTLKIVYENIIGSLGIKGAILICSAFGITNMWLAVFGDVGVTILAVLNALRLLKKSKKC